MKDIRDKNGRLTKIILEKSEWEDLTKFDKEAHEKGKNYLNKIRRERQFKKMPDGTVVGNFKLI